MEEQNLIFNNPQLDIHNLPAAEEVAWLPIEKSYLRVSILGLWIFSSIPLIIFLISAIANGGIEPWWVIWLVIGAWLFLMALITTLNILGFHIKGYALREHDIMYRSGLIIRKTVVLPFNRVQHSEITQGLIERQFNLSKLEIYTAGGSQSDLTIPGLKEDVAQQIRSYVLEKASHHE